MERNKKEEYENPSLDLLLFSDDDVITTSGENGDEGGGDYNGDKDWTGEWDPLD